jgi:hypothetical protein
MARRQHLLVLCVAALLLTAGCGADNASDAAAAAAQAAATPDVPQTSTNIAQADPDGVTVAEQRNREKVLTAPTHHQNSLRRNILHCVSPPYITERAAGCVLSQRHCYNV